MTQYYLKIQYSPSGRALCRGCAKRIDKGLLRIAFVVDGEDEYHMEKWYHIDCFTELPPQVQNIQLSDILEFGELKKKDQKLLEKKLQVLKQNNLNGNLKKDKKQGIQIINVEDDYLQKKIKTDQKKSNEIIEILDEELSEDAQLEVRPPGYRIGEWKIVKQNLETLDCKTALVLKKLLKYNKQPTVGIKIQLIERVADCIALGAIPKCPSCKGGRPIFDKNTGQYICAGYMSDKFIQCAKVFSKNEIVRLPWKSF